MINRSDWEKLKQFSVSNLWISTKFQVEKDLYSTTYNGHVQEAYIIYYQKMKQPFRRLDYWSRIVVSLLSSIMSSST